ncbi:MAG: LysE family translocator [Desulfobacterales bacterium]|nr:LysE family translocator [Desulfobacterales bacterium]MDD4073397.1 LysE family translocator [Desulfobacterales bacterium]MDD4392005.1 LysE family translocator [Desulfobacterales bacterium]
MIDHQVIAFAGFAAVLTLMPGPDTMLVIRSVLARGRACGLMTTAGICTGLFVHASLSAAGVSIVLVNSAAAFHILKTAGAGYLIYLGIKSILELRKPAANMNDFSGRISSSSIRQQANWRAFLEGMLNNVLNPKAAVFYLAFLPQFINPGDPVFAKSILLAGIHFGMGMVWLSMVTFFFGYMKTFLTGGRVTKWLQASSGAVLIVFGLRLAVENR